jgi:hypothetical protein
VEIREVTNVHREAATLRVITVLPVTEAREAIVRAATREAKDRRGRAIIIIQDRDRVQVRDLPADMVSVVWMTLKRMRKISQALIVPARVLKEVPAVKEAVNARILTSRF